MTQDGVGVLRPEEEAVGKRLLAESFFRKYKCVDYSIRLTLDSTC
jgi:hypothetical protein